MRFLIVVCGLLLASPAFAQSPPKYDEDGCTALARRMDVAEKAKQPIAADDKEQYELCVGFLRCDKTTTAGWDAASTTYEKLMRYILKTCQEYEPPEG